MQTFAVLAGSYGKEKLYNGLKLCPFCGGKAHVIEIDNERQARCEFCNARTIRCLTRRGAVKAWNRRV